MRISTQVYVLVDGERRVMEHISEGVARNMCVDIDLDQCGVCGALLPPILNGRHEEWHRTQPKPVLTRERGGVCVCALYPGGGSDTIPCGPACKKLETP